METVNGNNSSSFHSGNKKIRRDFGLFATPLHRRRRRSLGGDDGDDGDDDGGGDDNDACNMLQLTEFVIEAK